MRKIFCFDKHNIQLTHIADHLEKNLGLCLRGKPGVKEIHGVLFGNHYPAGEKEKMEYNAGRYWCNENLGDGEHSCVVLVLYENIKSIAGVMLPNGNPASEHTQKPHPKLQEIHKDISRHIDSFAGEKKITVCHHDPEVLKEHLDFFVALR